MANSEHLMLLMKGVKAWNKWRQKNPDVIPDLSRGLIGYLDFNGIDLSRAFLVGASITDAELVEADFSLANLSETDLNSSNFRGASFNGANLSNSNLCYANLRETDLRLAVLSGAGLVGADISGAVMLGTKIGDGWLDGTIGLDEVEHWGPSSLGIETIFHSKESLPEKFLRGCGVPENFITYMPSLKTTAIEFYSCFISYSSKDQEFAERLHADLQAKGVRVWFAPHDMAIGAPIRTTIDESIRVFDKLLLVLSETSVNSQWVEQEVETALEKERESTGKTTLFPIRIDDAVMNSKAGWPALIKRSRNIGDFHNWKEYGSYTKAFERLLRDLKATAN